MKKLYIISISGVSIIEPSIKPYKNTKVLGKDKIYKEPFGGEKVLGEAKTFGDSHVYGNAETCGKHSISVSKKKHIQVIKLEVFRYITTNIKK